MNHNWPDTLELTLDGIAQGGEGVGRADGRVVFANGGLPGERVLMRLDEGHERYARGTVLNVLEPAAERVGPRQPGATHMDWQHIDHAAQLRFKRTILADQLAKIGGLRDLPIGETVAPTTPWNYRASARFHIANGEVGYFAAGTRQVQPLSDDPLLLPLLNTALAALGSVVRPDDSASEAVLRASETHGYLAAFLRGPGDQRDLAERWMAACPLLRGVAWAGGAAGDPTIREMFGGVRFAVRPGTFAQTNLAGAAALLELVRAGLELRGDERLLDVYCGAGTFTLPLAREVASVVGVEEYAGAVEDARATATQNEIENATILAGAAERALATLDDTFDAAVLDPPRRGCNPRAISELLLLAPARIVYVSCQPATLARDLKLLVTGGYTVLGSQPVDLFPQTAHIESVTVLVRR